MIDGSIPMEIGVGGIFALMVIRETLNFIKARRNGKNNNDSMQELMVAADKALREHEDLRSRYKLLQDALEKQTTILGDVRDGIHNIHADMMTMGKDVVRGFTILGEDLHRSLPKESR